MIQSSTQLPFYPFETYRPEWGSNPWSPIFQAGSFNHCRVRNIDLNHLYNPHGIVVDMITLITVNSCTAELYVSIFHSFEAGIAYAISSFKWMEHNVI